MLPGTGSTTRESNARAPIGRFFKIHDEIRRGKYPNCKNLADKLEVTQKTIQRDITYMQNELKLPLVYEASRHGYYYHKPVQDFPLFKATSEDVVALFLARKALEPLRGTPLEAELRQSFRQLASSLQGHVTFRWSDLDQAVSVKEPGAMVADVRQFEKLADAVLALAMTLREHQIDCNDINSHSTLTSLYGILAMARIHNQNPRTYAEIMATTGDGRKIVRSFADNIIRLIDLAEQGNIDELSAIMAANKADHAAGFFAVPHETGKSCR